MEIINQHAKDYTVAWISLSPSSFSNYANTGDRKSIQWLYVASGELQITYTKNEYKGYYNMIGGILADLRPIKDLTTLWITPANVDTTCIAVMSADENTYHEAEVITLDNRSHYDQQVGQDRILIPLDDEITVNNTSIKKSSYVRVPAEKKILLRGNTRILVITLTDD